MEIIHANNKCLSKDSETERMIENARIFFMFETNARAMDRARATKPNTSNWHS